MVTSQAEILIDELPRVHAIAYAMARQAPGVLSCDDLVQEGVVGLIEAAKRFEPSMNVQFWLYAQHRVRGAMLDYARRLDWSDRRARKEGRGIEKCRHRLAQSMCRAATDEEVAQELGIPVQDLWQSLNDIHRSHISSLDDPMIEVNHETLAENVVGTSSEDPFQRCLVGQEKALLLRALAQLPDRERQVLVLYYFRDLMMREIGEAMGIGQARVSQLHSAGMKRLRYLMETQAQPSRIPRQSAAKEARK